MGTDILRIVLFQKGEIKMIIFNIQITRLEYNHVVTLIKMSIFTS